MSNLGKAVKDGFEQELFCELYRQFRQKAISKICLYNLYILDSRLWDSFWNMLGVQLKWGMHRQLEEERKAMGNLKLPVMRHLYHCLQREKEGLLRGQFCGQTRESLYKWIYDELRWPLLRCLYSELGVQIGVISRGGPSNE